MPNPYFKFKQFTVYHDRCAMKVGTDGVLLGAWAQVDNARRVLDIGTGTGLIALMTAQRSLAHIVGIDIDEKAVEQAEENVKASPWKERISICRKDVVQMCGEVDGTFDAIVSNPPYFVENVHCPDARRNVARHTGDLTFGGLLAAVERLLTEDGTFSVIIPTDAADDFVSLAAGKHLYPNRKTLIHTKLDAVPKRVLLAFGRQICACATEDLVVELERHVYSPAYIRLTKEFYLNM